MPTAALGSFGTIIIDEANIENSTGNIVSKCNATPAEGALAKILTVCSLYSHFVFGSHLSMA